MNHGNILRCVLGVGLCVGTGYGAARATPQAPPRAAAARAVSVRPPAPHWQTKVYGAVSWDTTDATRDMDQEVAAGAKLLKYPDGTYVHALHRQYNDTCGPASLSIVLAQLGVARVPATVFAASRGDAPTAAQPTPVAPSPGGALTSPPNATMALPRRPFTLPRDVDNQGTALVELGYYGSMEHVMWLSYHRKRLEPTQAYWNGGNFRFMSPGGHLETGSSGQPATTLGPAGEMGYLGFALIPEWLWNAPAQGWLGPQHPDKELPGVANYFFSGAADGPWRDARPMGTQGSTDAEVAAIQRVIKGFIDHGMAFVVGVEHGRHINAAIGYRGSPGGTFYLYTADPLDGWGRSAASQPLRWRRFLVNRQTVESGARLLSGMLPWNQHAEGPAGGFGPSRWASGVDAVNRNTWLLGNPVPDLDPLADPFARRDER